jgi:Ca2+-binding RTX toxin-like protein
MFEFRRQSLGVFGVTVLAAVASTALTGASASAASTGTAKVVGTGTVEFTAAGGKANAVTVSRSGKVVTIDDKVAVKAGKGCKAVKGDKTKVRCTTSGTTTLIKITLGDQDDSLTNKAGVKLSAWGGAGKDKLTGGSRVDLLHGGAGNDTVRGGGGTDALYGDSGNDRLEGGAGDEDLLLGGTGKDTLSGGGGQGDIVSYADHKKAVTADLDFALQDDGQSGEHDTIMADVESLIGGTAGDKLTGNTQRNELSGGKGNDTIRGGGNSDRLFGNAGNDRIYGEGDDDFLVGENWSDSSGKSTGNKKAKDKLDGGANGAFGDHCLVLAAGTTVRCES